MKNEEALNQDVYIIRHKITDRMYIGSSKNVNRRIGNHINALRRGKHPVEDMRKDFDIYGENYSFEIFENVNDRSEYHLMDRYNSRLRGVGYNYKDNHYRPYKSGYYLVKVKMTRLGITYKDIGNALGYSSGTTSMKINGRYPLTLNEAKIIRDIVAPGMLIDDLFEEAG